MREFITQNKLTDEFINFLKETNDWDNYVRELSHTCDCLNDIGIYDEKHPIALLSKYVENGNIEEYLYRVASRQPIIDVRVPLLSAYTINFSYVLSRIEHDFIGYINGKYNDKIKSTCLEKKSLLIRWMKEENAIGIFNNLYGGKESIIESINPYLENFIPYMIFPRVKTSKSASNLIILRNRFRIFYTRIITDEKS